MTVQPVRLFGDPVLRARADEVTTFDRELRQLVADLTDTMRASGGVGMAAPQIGVGLRVFVYDTGELAGHLVNPVFEVLGDQEQTGPEGCLSIPGLRYEVTRALRVWARGVDMDGAAVEFEAEGLPARCVQHETDHLDGVLYLDRLDPAARKEAMRAVRESGWFTTGQTVMSAADVSSARSEATGRGR
ncbi:peptide deformylase [Nocardia terpenica]|uniref:peptide deformylase n=1 Tax=Nocardia terpenica TaxID=455432 RepID=UPI0018960258|nr:peptide deformylase [Nocardia terpenica]MBF6059665.1 peptide deformylase [Nocardia terpenica]MBF6102794.1 peptide deformylase [Nocardia terpenica]MBF6111015.1 peptide deformylase [Nocardia terpenica]MBF6117146.1 peptide deformylase [Nocardia terpenica]MBF6151013.1 peptide deformylase [Nocardia terpenica]